MLRVRRVTALFLGLSAIALLSACGGDGGNNDNNPVGGGSGSGLAGTWTAQSFSVDGTDLTPQGVGIVLTFTESTYTLDVSGDTNGIFCTPPDTSCSNGGAISTTATTVTIDPGTAQELTLSYTVNGNTLTLTGDIAGHNVVAVLTR